MRVIACYAARELIPLYGVYALLFSDAGLSPAAISSLLIIWSTTSVVFEVPSGAWADVIDRRLLLVLSSVIYASGFALWVVWPTYAGFAIGFVLWGLSGALMSGTFEAYLYDELVATGNAAMYARLLGRAESAAMVASLAATAAGAPLFALGGYSMVGWVSVAAALIHGAFALSLPAAPKSETADETVVAAGGTAGTTLTERYVTMLRSGWREATHHRTVRHIVLISAVLMGVSAYDEYFGLLARETGASTAHVPLLMAVVAVGQVAGAALAGRTATWSRRRLAVLVGTAGVLVAAGAVTGHPIGILGIAAGYGLAHNAMVVADARLQAVITGPARATITSVAGLSSEVFAICCYATFALGSWWLATGTLVAILCIPILGIAGAMRVWWPDPPGEPDHDSDSDSDADAVDVRRPFPTALRPKGSGTVAHDVRYGRPDGETDEA